MRFGTIRSTEHEAKKSSGLARTSIRLLPEDDHRAAREGIRTARDWADLFRKVCASFKVDRENALRQPSGLLATVNGKPSAHRAGLFREGRTIADLSCLIDEGARLTVREESNGGIHFAQYREFDRTALLEAVE